jgi:hypothetical protein
MNIRLISLQGGDEFNVSVRGVQHQERIRPDGAWIVSREIAEALMSSPICGYVERYDDESTLSEIRLLASVLQDQTMRNAINAAIVSRAMLSLR